MGYFKNHLATLVTGVFAAILTALWPYFSGFAPVLDFVFLMAVPIAWFLVVILWLAQLSTDYMHGRDHDRTANVMEHATEPTIIHLEGTTADSIADAVLNQAASPPQEKPEELKDTKAAV